MKYIDSEKLIAEIEFAKSVYNNPKRVIHGVEDAFRQDGRAAMCDDILKKIASLQQEQLGGGYSEKPNNLLSEKQERTRGIDGVVHHSLRAHWIVTDQKQLATALKAFPEGTEVELFIFARKEDIVI